VLVPCCTCTDRTVLCWVRQVECYNPCPLCGAQFMATPFEGKPVSLSTIDDSHQILTYKQI
jgi:hypothetical protein